MSEGSLTLAPPVVPPATCVLVSGGSRGLGLAVVRDVLDRGARVATFARTVTPELTALAEEHPDRVYAAAVNATDWEAAHRFVAIATERLGPVDGLVNNAAVGQDSLLAHTSPDRVARIVDTNVVAPLLLTRAVLRRLMARGGRARIVTITSVCAARGYPGLVAYAATKGALEAATRSLARELSGRALVNCVAPGFFASEMSSVLGADQLGSIQRRTPTGRLVDTTDVVPVVSMLLFGDTSINGQVLTVDGGGSV